MACQTWRLPRLKWHWLQLAFVLDFSNEGVVRMNLSLWVQLATIFVSGSACSIVALVLFKLGAPLTPAIAVGALFGGAINQIIRTRLEAAREEEKKGDSPLTA